MEPKIHEPRRCASIPPSGLDGIDVHGRAGIAEHAILRACILLERLQFLKDNFVHRNSTSLPRLTRPWPLRFVVLCRSYQPRPFECLNHHWLDVAQMFLTEEFLERNRAHFIFAMAALVRLGPW